MNLSLENNNDACTISVDGELDRDTLQENLWLSLSSESQEIIKHTKDVSIDLGKVGRADTAGLAWLLNAIRDISLVNQSVSITNIPQKLVDLAALSNANQLITKKRGKL